MPNRYIEIPTSVLIMDPATGKPIPDSDKGGDLTWDFDYAMEKLLSHPMWGETFAAMRSQEALHTAWKDAKDGVIAFAEEDWLKLKQAVENPRVTINTMSGPQIVAGFNVHPSLVRYLVPLLSPIMDAKTERPKAKPVLAPVAVAAETTTPSERLS